MVNPSYAKGYRFEKRVQKDLEKHGWKTYRQGKSAFPDLICVKKGTSRMLTYLVFVECKMNKYLSKKEKELAKEINKDFMFFVAWKDKKRKIIYTPLDDIIKRKKALK